MKIKESGSPENGIWSKVENNCSHARVVSYAAAISVITQCLGERALRDDTNRGCIGV